MNPVLTARIVGLAYVVIILSAPFAEMFVRGGTVVDGDAAATAANIMAGEQLWRWAGAAEFLVTVCDVIVAILLYVLLKPLGRTVSLLAAVFQLVMVAVSSVKILFHLLPLSLLAAGGTYLTHFTPEQLQDLSYLSIRLHSRAYDISMFLFGAHLVLIGWLILRATFLPRFLGGVLAVAGIFYIANTMIRVVAPDLAGPLYPWILLPGFLGETTLALWLLIRGVNATKWREQAGS